MDETPVCLSRAGGRERRCWVIFFSLHSTGLVGGENWGSIPSFWSWKRSSPSWGKVSVSHWGTKTSAPLGMWAGKVKLWGLMNQSWYESDPWQLRRASFWKQVGMLAVWLLLAERSFSSGHYLQASSFKVQGTSLGFLGKGTRKIPHCIPPHSVQAHSPPLSWAWCYSDSCHGDIPMHGWS